MEVEETTSGSLPAGVSPTGPQVKAARKLLGCSRQFLADRARATYTLIYRIETVQCRDKPSEESFAPVRPPSKPPASSSPTAISWA
jgi:hypothetical protein